jgi:formamidopyrimidine-DNA glycosylase
MPELPDLAYVESVLRPALIGHRITAARTGDPTVLRIMVPGTLDGFQTSVPGTPDGFQTSVSGTLDGFQTSQPFPDLLVGKVITAVDRRGHFMRFALNDDLVLVVNAMLVGRYKLIPPTTATTSDGGARKKDPRALGLALVLDDGAQLHYVDDKRMGKVYVARTTDEQQIPIYGQLGLDVLSPAFTRQAFGRLIGKRRDQVRMFLMDKRALASIGNAYADEILFAARIHPKTFCNKLAPAEIDALYAAIPTVLNQAITEIARRREPVDVKVRDFLSVRGRDGKPCPRCGTTIRAVRVGDGDACFCPTCQPTGRKLFVDFRGLQKS